MLNLTWRAIRPTPCSTYQSHSLVRHCAGQSMKGKELAMSLLQQFKTRVPGLRKLAAGVALAAGVGLMAPAAMAQHHGGGGGGGGWAGGGGGGWGRGGGG